MRKLTSLLLVAVWLGALASPHPCSAGQSPARARPATASCHGMGADPVSAAGAMAATCHRGAAHRTGAPAPARHPASPAGDCCDTLCQSACQMPALAAVQPAALGLHPGSAAAFEVSAPALSRFASAIDHIPHALA